jgi:Tn3 transposase DDE domain
LAPDQVGVKRWTQRITQPAGALNFFARAFERETLLRHELEKVDSLASQDQLPDAEIADGMLKVTPLTNAVPEEAEALMRQAYALLPHVKVQEPAKDRPLLLTVILADAINLGLHKMAEACPGTSIAKLSWLSAWHIRDEMYSKALTRLVNHQHRQPSLPTGAKGPPLLPMDSSFGQVAAGSKRAKSIFVTAPNPECSSTPTCRTSTRRFTPSVALHLNRRLWQFTALNSWTGGLSIGSNSWKHCT